MRRLALMAWAGTAAIAATADQTVARWTLLQGGRVSIAGRTITDIADLPAGDFTLEMVDWVAVNAVPEDLERMTGLRHLRELRLPGPLWNRNADGGKDLSTQLKFLAPVTTLEKLTFSDHFLDRIRFRDEGLDQISTLGNLRELALRQAEVKGSGLRHFARLQALDLTLCPVADFAPLAGMKELKKLWAGDTLVSDLAPLAGLRQLEDLDLHGTGIGDDAINHLAGLTALRRLDLQGTGITDAALATIEQLPKLESLNLYRTRISNDGLAQLAKLTRLRTLDIRYTRATESGFQQLRVALPNTRIAFVGGGGRNGPAIPPPADSSPATLARWIAALGGTARLSQGYVSLKGVPLESAALEAVSRFGGLRTLDLDSTELGDAAMAVVAKIESLQELSLNQTQVSDAGLAALGKLPRLRRLKLNNTFVEGRGFAGWLRTSPLEELSLLGTPANDAGLEGLSHLTKLRVLVLAESDVTGAGLKHLAPLQLEALDLSGTDVGDDAPLGQFTALRRLSLRDTRVTDVAIQQLAALPHLETLDLARTRTTNAGLDGLARLTGLRTLDLAYAEVDDAGISKLAGLTQLETLTLDSTHITDKSGTQLAAFPKLKRLDLYHSLITAEGLARLKRALPGTNIIWDKDAALPHRRRA